MYFLCNDITNSVQILHPFEGSIQQYAEWISDPDHDRPQHCPQCQTRKSLCAHGFYRRTLVDVEFDGIIRVRRDTLSRHSLARQPRYCNLLIVGRQNRRFAKETLLAISSYC